MRRSPKRWRRSTRRGAPRVRDSQAAHRRGVSRSGQPEGSFDRTLEQAIVPLLQTPVRDGPARVQPHGIVYAYADSKERISPPAQKQLLRMGPANARIVQAKLREIALALEHTAQRLPASSRNFSAGRTPAASVDLRRSTSSASRSLPSRSRSSNSVDAARHARTR